jgi:hypothetical protein
MSRPHVLPPPAWLPQLLELRAECPGDHPNTLAAKLYARHGITTIGRVVRDALARGDADGLFTGGGGAVITTPSPPCSTAKG